MVQAHLYPGILKEECGPMQWSAHWHMVWNSSMPHAALPHVGRCNTVVNALQ